MTRKLASVRQITNVTPIPKADRVELVHILGWRIVCKKGEYKPGDLCVFIEIDSFVPETVAPFLTTSSGPKLYKGITGNRVKSRKMLGQLSQGLILPLKSLMVCESLADYYNGDDVTDHLSIIKWENEVPLSAKTGNQRGVWPSFIPKTDQERLQNIDDDTLLEWKDWTWEITEKLDGTSMTIYFYEGEMHVCSRNVDLHDGDNMYWNAARALNLDSSQQDGLAFQGELIGPGIQGNQYGLVEHQFRLFDIWGISGQMYFNSMERGRWAQAFKILEVPLLDYKHLGTRDEVMQWADGPSVFNTTKREGLVFKAEGEPSFSFKVISNDWLGEYE